MKQSYCPYLGFPKQNSKAWMTLPVLLIYFKCCKCCFFHAKLKILSTCGILKCTQNSVFKIAVNLTEKQYESHFQRRETFHSELPSPFPVTFCISLAAWRVYKWSLQQLHHLQLYRSQEPAYLFHIWNYVSCIQWGELQTCKYRWKTYPQCINCVSWVHSPN